MISKWSESQKVPCRRAPCNQSRGFRAFRLTSPGKKRQLPRPSWADEVKPLEMPPLGWAWEGVNLWWERRACNLRLCRWWSFWFNWFFVYKIREDLTHALQLLWWRNLWTYTFCDEVGRCAMQNLCIPDLLLPLTPLSPHTVVLRQWPLSSVLLW